MSTFFVSILVKPLPDNPLIEKVEEARVYFWIVEEFPEKATERARDYLARYKWKIDLVEKHPTEVTAADFAEQEEALLGFWKAKQKGFAAQFRAKPKLSNAGQT